MRHFTLAASAVALATIGLFSCDRSPTAPRLDQLTFDVVSGDGQTAVAGTQLAPLVVKVTSGGNPVVVQILNFRVVSGGGSVYGGTELTDNDGIAQELWTLGTNASQPQKVEVRAVESSTGAEKIFATFAATATADKASSLSAAAGKNQTALAGSAVAIAPAAQVTDQYGNPIAGVTVSFAVTGGGGTIINPSQTTGTNGIATSGTWTLGTTAGPNTLTATSAGLAGSPVTFTALGVTGSAARLVIVSGNNQSASPGGVLQQNPTVQVVDGNGNGVSNVAVTFTVTNGGGSINGVGSVTTLTSSGSGSLPVGAAAVSWTLGSAAGPNAMTAIAVGLSGSPVSFAATGIALAWTQLNPTPDPTYGTPSLRFSNSTVYNTTSNRLIIFGGEGAFSSSVFNDVWVMTNADGTGGPPAWIMLNPIGGPPGGRTAHVAVYDQENNRMIIQGGYTQPGFCEGVVSDVWVLSNADGSSGTPTWTQLSPTGTAPARRYAGAVYDMANNRLIVNGGDPAGCGPGVNDTWVLTNANGLGGTPAWTKLAPTTPSNLPGDMSGGNTGYDAVSNTLIRSLAVNGSLSIWLLSNANGVGGSPAWSQLVTGAGPVVQNWIAGTSIGGGVYDRGTNTFVLFGGNTSSSETWTLVNANGTGTAQWNQLSPTGTLPVGRLFAFAGYAPGTGRLTIYGGSKSGNDGTNEIWVLPVGIH